MPSVDLDSPLEDSEDFPLVGSDETDQPYDRPSMDFAPWTGNLPTLALALFVQVLFVFNDISRYLASLRLLSQGVCREYLLEHDPTSIVSGASIPEDQCHFPSVQQRIARLGGYLLSLDAFLALIFTIPYGLMLDRLSERSLASLNIIGFLLSSSWLLVVFSNWNVFPVWMAVLAPFFSVIGGGASIFDSVMSVIVVRRVPSRLRSVFFGFFSAAALLMQVISITVTSSLMENGYLFTPMVLNFPVGIVTLIALFWIRPIHQTRSSNPEVGLVTWRALKIELASTFAALTRLMTKPGGFGLLMAVPLAKMVEPLAEVTLLYVQKKFDFSFAQASRVLTFQTVEGLVLLVAAIPLIKHVTQTKLRFPVTKVDWYLTVIGFMCMSTGSLILGFSQAWIPFVFGLIVLTAGWGTGSALKSVLTDMVVSPDNLAALYTVLALCDSIGMAAGSFVLNRSYAFAVGLDDWRQLGLPYFVAFICFSMGGVGSWAFRSWLIS